MFDLHNLYMSNLHIFFILLWESFCTNQLILKISHINVTSIDRKDLVRNEKENLFRESSFIMRHDKENLFTDHLP